MKVPKSPGYKLKFQSTLPVWGATPQFWTLEVAMERFQSMLPVWGATTTDLTACCVAIISIHAPRVGSDHPNDYAMEFSQNFNPRSPWGSDRTRRLTTNGFPNFNPRSPWGGATNKAIATYLGISISIHAPRGGSDWAWCFCNLNNNDFNPHSAARGSDTDD